MKNVSTAMIMEMAFNGDALGKAQAKVLFSMLNKNLTTMLEEVDATEDHNTKAMAKVDKSMAKLTKGDKKIIAQAAKAKAKDSKGAQGKASQSRNNHSKAKIAGKKAGKTVPDLIIEWFGRKKSLKTIAQIAEGTGLTNKEVGDACWGQVNKEVMVGSGDGSYGMA